MGWVCTSFRLRRLHLSLGSALRYLAWICNLKSPVTRIRQSLMLLQFRQSPIMTTDQIPTQHVAVSATWPSEFRFSIEVREVACPPCLLIRTLRGVHVQAKKTVCVTLMDQWRSRLPKGVCLLLSKRIGTGICTTDFTTRFPLSAQTSVSLRIIPSRSRCSGSLRSKG